MRPRRATTLLWTLLTVAWVHEARAVPAFSRRYALPCHYCHDGYPKLSPIGEQFKDRGFRLEQNDAFEVKKFLKEVPVTLRAGVNQTFVEDGDATTGAFFKVVTAGNLGPRFSYWFDHQFVATRAGGFDRVGTDNAWMRVEIVPGRLYARGGRFELDLPFSQARSPHLLAYDVYFQNTGFETDTIGLAQDGGELGGTLGPSARWSVAVVRGRNSDQAEDLTSRAGRFDGNVYGRIRLRQGQNRAGGLVYWGRNVLARSDRGRVVSWTDGLLRLGVDGETWVERVNLYGLLLYGRNSNSAASAASPNGTRVPQSFTGGFVQGDFHLRDELVPTFRLNVVRRPQNQQTYVGVVPGVEIWLHPQVKLSFEVSLYNRGVPTVGAFQIEVGI